MTWLKRAKVFNIRRKIALSRETTLQHRTNYVGVKATCRIAVELKQRPGHGLLLYTYIQWGFNYYLYEVSGPCLGP